MSGGGLLDIVHHDLLGLVGVVVVHDEHDALLKERVALLIAHFLQGQQAVFTGHLGQLHQLLDDGHGVILFGVHQNAEVLGDSGQGGNGEAGDQHGEGTADGDEYGRAVNEVADLAGSQKASVAAPHHADDHYAERGDDANDICNIHSLKSTPYFRFFSIGAHLIGVA